MRSIPRRIVIRRRLRYKGEGPRYSRARSRIAQRSLAVVPVLLACVLMMPVVGAHGAGSQAVGARDSFLLSPAGTSNDSLHAYLSDFGLPIDAGDTLRFSWESENGSGPPIHFEIHSHALTESCVLPDRPRGICYQRNASEDLGTWTVPRTEPYMVYWLNPNPVSVNLSYALTLFPPPPSLAFVILLALLGSAPLTLVAIAVIWWLARRKRRQATPPSS